MDSFAPVFQQRVHAKVVQGEQALLTSAMLLQK
jgi:hypothetical protein